MKYLLLAGAMMLLPAPAFAHEIMPTIPTTPAAPSGPTAPVRAAGPTRSATPAVASATLGPVTTSSGATSRSVSRSRSKSSSSVTVNNPGNTGGGGSGGGSGGSSGNGGRAPDVFAPSLSGGSPCTVGGSAGGSGLLGGGTLGALWESHDCALRQQAALFANLGRPDVAIEILCHDAWVRDAMAKALTPCAIDRERWLAMGWTPTAPKP